MSITLPPEANYEPGEVRLGSLPPGAVVLVGRTKAIVVEQCRASTTVAIRQEKFRVITAQDGRKSAPIRLPDKREHWDSTCGVTATGETVDPKRFLDEAPTPGPEVPGERPVDGGNTMAKAKKARAQKAPKEPKEKTYLVAKYQLTAKADGEKYAKLFDKDNAGYAAVIMRAIKGAGEPLGFLDLLITVKGAVKTSANKEANTRWYVNDLVKKGLIKSVTDKVEATTREEALGAQA